MNIYKVLSSKFTNKSAFHHLLGYIDWKSMNLSFSRKKMQEITRIF